MSKIVHVIHPEGKPRWERSYGDSTPDERILKELTSPSFKRHVGYMGTVMRAEEETGRVVPHADPASGFIVDHPDTVIAVGHVVDNKFVEDRRLKGPALTPSPLGVS